MDIEKIKLKRHSERWDAGNLTVRRTALTGLVFAAVVLFNVLEPYEETAPARRQFQELTDRNVKLSSELEVLSEAEESLLRLQDTIEGAPWSIYKEELIKKFSAGEVLNPGEDGNATLARIAASVRKEVLNPLAGTADGIEGPLSVSLQEHVERVGEEIENWEAVHRDTPWFRTIVEKGLTVNGLTDVLSRLQVELVGIVGERKQEIQAKQEALGREHSLREKDINAIQSSIQQELDEAIPWAKGLVSVEMMAATYPLALTLLAVYFVASGKSLARDFRQIAVIENYSEQDRANPILSSVWTLTYRGRSGTAITVLAYLSVIMALWACLIRGLDSIGGDALFARASWVFHGAMGLAVAVVISSTVPSRSE